MYQNYTPPDAFIDHAAVLHDMGVRLHRSLEGAHRALWPEMYQALDEAREAICDTTDFDCVSGDMHVLTPAEQWEEEAGPIGALSLSMLDTCLEAFHSEAEAGGVMLELEERGILVRPALCPSCLRWHLERGR